VKDWLENILKTLAGKLTLAFLGLISVVMLGLIVILGFTLGGRALAWAIGGRCRWF
jgi:type IV secretory pathway VirB2 component (pilin)